MSGKDDILREVQETQAQSATIVAALTALSNVVQPLMAAAAQSKTAMEAAQAALAASTADTLALEEQLAAAAVALDSSQTGVQAALDAVPPLPAVV